MSSSGTGPANGLARTVSITLDTFSHALCAMQEEAAPMAELV